MGYNTQDEIVKIVNRLIKRCGTRNPYKVADELGIHILYRDFTKQRGAYKVILKNRFIFLQNGLHPVIEQIVLWHEIGHDVLHRQEAVSAGVHYYKATADTEKSRIITDWEEWQANTLAAAILLPRCLIEKGMFLFGLGDKIECLNKIYYPAVYERYAALSDFLGCSKKALAIRMQRTLHKIQQYPLRCTFQTAVCLQCLCAEKKMQSR